MPRVFISHSSLDRPAATTIKEWLTTAGFDAPFLDTDPQDGIAPGADWERTLYHELERADALIIILTANWMASKWCFVEFAQARALGKPVYPVIETPAGDHIFAPDIQHLDLRSDREGGLERLERELWRVAGNTRRGLRLPPGRPPYPGLLAFQEADAAVYFGRDTEIRRFLELLRSQRVLGSANVFAILGASGSGKSSLLRAGVIPRLRQEALTWTILSPWRLRDRPIEALALALTLAFKDTGRVPDLSHRLIEDPTSVLVQCETLARLASGAPETQIVLSIDQFEEVFALEAAEAAQVWRILELVSARRGGFVLLLTLRSDFLNNFQTAPDRRFDMVPFTLDPLPVTGLVEIIRNPGKVANILIDDAFVRAAKQDAKDSQALPLLAFALREIYEAKAGHGHWTVHDYNSLGDPASGKNPIENAVRRAADRVITTVAAGRNAADLIQRVFIPNLVRVNDEGRYIRKPSSRPKLDTAGGDLVDALIAARLLTTWDENGIRMVEVAHEALFTAWDLLATVLREHHAFLLGLQQLARDQAEWAEAVKVGRQGDLLTGLRLARAREWFESGRLEGAQHDFVARSIAAADALARSARRRRQIFLGLGMAAVLLVGAVSYFANEGRRAQTRAQAAQLVTAAMTEIEKAQIRSAAADAGQAYDLAPTNETRSLLLHLMLQVSGHLEQIHSLGPIAPVQLAWSPDGKRIIAAGNKGQLVEWRFDRQGVTSLRTSDGYDPAGSRAGPLALGWDEKNHFVAINSDGKLVREDVAASTTLALPSGDRVSLASADAAGVGILAVAKVTDGGPIVFESNGHPVPLQGNCRNGVVTTGFTSAIAMAPDGSRLILGTDEGWLCSVVRIGSDQPHTQHVDSSVRAIAVAGTAGHIAARLEDGRIFIAGFDLSDPVFIPKESESPRSPLLAWSPDGIHLASPCRSHSLCIWAVEARRSDRIRAVVELEGADRVQALAWSPDGRRLASADATGNLAVWNMQPDTTAYTAPIKRGTGLISLAATPDGARLIAGSANGDLVLLELNSRTVLSFSTMTQSGDDRAIVSLAPHPTEQSLIVAAKNGWLTVRHIPDGAEQRSYDLQSMKPLTAATWLGNGSRFAVAGAFDLVLLESDSSLRDALERLPGSGDIQAMVFDENHQQLLTTGDDDRVLAWNVGPPRIVTPYRAVVNVDPLLRGRSVLALSPGGTQVATAGNDGQVLVYNTTTKAVVQRFKAGFQIDAAAFSTDGKMLVSVRPDGYIEVWDTTDGSAPFARARLSSVPQTVIFLARQNAFAIGDNEGVIRIFGIDPNSWRSRAGRLASE